LSEWRKLTAEQLDAAEELIARKLKARGVEFVGEIEVVATRYFEEVLTIAYLLDGVRAFHVITNVPEKDQLA